MLDIGICVLLVAPYGVLLTAPVFAKAAAGLHAGVRTCMHAHRGAFANAAATIAVCNYCHISCAILCVIDSVVQLLVLSTCTIRSSKQQVSTCLSMHGTCVCTL